MWSSIGLGGLFGAIQGVWRLSKRLGGLFGGLAGGSEAYFETIKGVLRPIWDHP